ncbi:phage baseplate assembly protein V [Bradyrhizobium sp. HKCCYLS20291]|uniref:phage baseplate assembly protein V n=1 Tax=Bradyrhizobium sp. HKCCYLS20291 TaxID=3420766 RepID=UPI003EBE0F90
MSLLELLSEKSDSDLTTGCVFGAVIGIVSNVADPDGLGRVKVRYPWLKDDSESPWARVVSFMAGAGRGAVFRPDVDDEVLVVFDHGDMRFPYVLGAVWNGKDAMPKERGSDKDNAVRMIKSRSGHQILFDDTAGAEKVTVIDKSGNSIEMSSTGVVVKASSIKIGSSAASEAMVLGNALMQLFNSHTHPTGVGPSGPPVQPMMAGNHVSTKHKTE